MVTPPPAAVAVAPTDVSSPTFTLAAAESVVPHTATVAKAPAAIPSSPAGWSSHLTTASHSIRDSSGTTWLPATGIAGGQTMTTGGGIGNTSSPALYQVARVGIQTWSVHVPSAGTYALDILIADTTNASAGKRVFSVTASDGTRTTALATNLDPTAAVGGWHPYHLTATMTLARASLTLTFKASKGTSVVSGLSIQSAATPGRVVLNQTFTGKAGSAPDPTVWAFQTGTGWEGSSGVENYTASSSNVALNGSGDLAISAVRKTTGNGSGSYTSGRIESSGKFTFGYGHVEARMKLPAGSGMWPAFWALGANQNKVDWPTCGEIDIAEGLGVSPQTVSGHVHSLGDSSDPVGYHNSHIASLGLDWNSGINTSSAFHTYAIDYRPGSITFEFDGQPYFVATEEDMAAGESWPFTGAQNYLLLNLAVGDFDWTGWAPSEPVGSKHTLLIDSVTVTT